MVATLKYKWHHLCERYYGVVLEGCLCPIEKLKLIDKIDYHYKQKQKAG